MIINENTPIRNFIKKASDRIKYYSGKSDSKYDFRDTPTQDELSNNPLGKLVSKGNDELTKDFKNTIDKSAKIDRDSGVLRYTFSATRVPKDVADKVKPGGEFYDMVKDYKDKTVTMEVPLSGSKALDRRNKKAEKKAQKNMKNKPQSTNDNNESMMTPVQVPEDERSLQCDENGNLILKEAEEWNDSTDDPEYVADEDSGDVPFYKYLRTKSVLDSDGFWTDYTMYYDLRNDQYVFIFGDNDIYNPTNTEPDWEEEDFDAATEWFDSYNGFEDDEDLDLDLDWHDESSEDKFSDDYKIDVGSEWGEDEELSDEEIQADLDAASKEWGTDKDDEADLESLELKESEEDKPKKLYHCDDCGYEVELTDDEYDGVCPRCHEHHGFYAYEDEDVNEQILNETPGLTLSTPKVTYKDQDDYEGRLEIEINGKKYMYRCNMGTDATAREMADKVAKMQKYSDGKALAYLKKNMHLVTEGVKAGDKVKVDTNFRGATPKIKEVEITKVEPGLATRDDKRPPRTITVKDSSGAEFKVDENQIVKESILKEDKSINWIEIPDRDLYIWKSDLEVDSTYDSVRAGNVALTKNHKVPAFVVKGSPDRGYEVTIPLHNWKRRSIATKDTPEEAFAAAEEYRQSHVDDYSRIDEAVTKKVNAQTLRDEVEDEFYKVAMSSNWDGPVVWGYETREDVDDFMMPRIEVQVDPEDRGRLIVTVAAEYSDYDAQYNMDEELNKVIRKYDAGSYFEQVEPGISEAIVYVDDRAGKSVITGPLRGQDYAYEGLQLKTEAHYGGAFDIADDQYFTRDDLDMFAEELLDNLKIFTNGDIDFDIGDIDIQNGNELFVEVDAEGNSFFGKVKIDMRKIKTPASLTVKYVPEILIQIMKQIDEYNKEGFSEITLSDTARKMIGESVKVDEGLQLKTEANVIYDNPDSKEAKLVKMEQNLHIYIHQKMWKDALNMAEYIVEILKDIIRDDMSQYESLEVNPSDGWSEEVSDVVSDVLNDCNDLLYEIDSAYRGYVSKAHTVEELADYIDGLAMRLSSAAEDLDSQADKLNEEVKTEKVSFKDAYICKGCGKPLSQCTCGIKEEDLKESVLAPGKEFTSKSGHWIKIVSVEPFVSDYNGDASLRIEYEYKTTDGREGKDTCNNWDLFNMLNESATQVSNIGQHKSSSIDLIEDEKEEEEKE